MRAWWRQVVTDYALDPHHLKLLEGAADASDRLVMARSALLKDGLTIAGKDSPKAQSRGEHRARQQTCLRAPTPRTGVGLPTTATGARWRPPALRSNRRL